MSAILFSVKPGPQSDAGTAIEFIRRHGVVAWGSNVAINPEKFAASETNPLIGYINHESYVRYKVNIIEIIRYDSPQEYPNADERPEGWADAAFSTFFRYNHMEEISPVKTTSLVKTNGDQVKHPPQNYIEVEEI